jgi:hypothetical protein
VLYWWWGFEKAGGQGMRKVKNNAKQLIGGLGTVQEVAQERKQWRFWIVIRKGKW